MVPWVRLDLKGCQVNKVFKASKVLKGCQDSKGFRVFRDLRVSADWKWCVYLAEFRMNLALRDMPIVLPESKFLEADTQLVAITLIPAL